MTVGILGAAPGERLVLLELGRDEDAKERVEEDDHEEDDAQGEPHVVLERLEHELGLRLQMCENFE